MHCTREDTPKDGGVIIDALHAPAQEARPTRIARALETLPLVAEALAGGQVSYAKVRAITRVATLETEARLLAVARAGTPAARGAAAGRSAQ
jgi:hypothetical protein